MAKFSDILDNTDSYVLGDNKKKTSRASQQVLDRVNEIRSGLKREDERLHQTRPKKTIGKYSDILDIETEQLGKDKELPDIPFVFPDNLFKKEQKLETPLAKEETGQQISSENIFDILSRTRPPFTGSEPITEPVIEQRTEKQPTFNILDFANKQKQEIDELRKEYDSAGGIETQIDINKAINENVGKELNKILEFPALKPIKESLERLAKNSGYQRQIESARYVKLLRMKEEAKRLGADTGYYDSEIAKLKENLDQPEFRRFSENILATAQLGISVIPKMMLLNAASEPAMKLTGDIAESIGGKELRPITETLTHFGLTATLGLPVLIGSLTSMGADYVADKLLQGTELNEKDKALILEAVQHFSFIGGLAAGSKAKTSVKNFLDTEKTMESIFDARTKAEKKAAEKRLKELRKINQERPLTSDELKEYRYLQKPREVIFGTPGIETIARYEKTLGRPLTKQEQKIVDIYNKRQEDIRNNPDEAYSREETRLYEDKVRKIREESGEEIIDVYKLLYPEEFGEIEAPKTPKAEETTRIRGLLGEETPPPVLRRGVPPEPLSGITLEEEAKLLNEAANKIARGNDDKLTEAEIEVRDRYPNYVKNLAEEIRQTPEFKEEYKLKRQAEKRRIKDETTSYSDLVREFRHAQKKGMLFDSPDIRESIDAIVTPEIRTKAENLHKEISDYNEKRIKRNELTLENLSRRKYKTSDLNKLTQQQQTDLLNEFNEMKKQGINEFNQIQKHRPVLQKIKEEDYAVPESKAESLLQRKPEEIRETGGGRGGVEPSIGRIETAPEEKAGEEKIIKKPSKEETRSITKSYQGGGQGYSKVKLNQEAIDKIGLENFNKYAKKYIEDNISRKNLPEDRTLAEAYLIEEFRNRVVNEEPQLLKDYPDLQKKTEPVKELRGRDLFTQEELRRFDAQNIDVSKVPAKYKEEALQQLAFKEKGTMKNEDVRKEYDREERNRLISDMNLDVASGLRDRIEKFYEKKLDEFSVKELKQIQKAIEAGETFYEAEEKPIEPKKEPEASGDFIKIPINELRTSLKDFQGRQREYSKQTYDRIITEAESGELNISGIPPIQIWKNPKTGEYNILAGHSRTKAFGDIYKGRIIDPQTGKARAPRLDPKYKTSQFGKINAQIVKANTLEEAVKIAQESNQGAIQTDIENAKYFKKLREKFGSKAEMENKARQLYGSNAQRIIDYSYLAEGGNTWEALKQFGLTSEQESKDVIKRIAQYIGRARKLYPSLTDSHENELYSWLNEGASQKLNMADFIGRIENIVLRPDFNPVSPLNIANRVTKGYYERTVDNQIKEVTAEIKKLEAERSSKTNPPSEARLNKISEEIGYLNKELAKLLNDLRSAKEADRQQTELFGSIEESVKEGVLSNEKVEEIISTTDTEELSKFAEDIERKAEDAESKQSIEKAEQVIKEIDEGVLDLSKESLKAEGTKEEKQAELGKVISASSRFRPEGYVKFNPPLVGPSGAKLTGYVWRYELTEPEPDRIKRISDWAQAEISDDTGREIVHQYSVTMPNGENKTVSSESVLSLLGYSEGKGSAKTGNVLTTAKTLAKNKMILALMEEQEKKYKEAREKYEKAKKPEIVEIEEPSGYQHLIEENKRGIFNVYAMGDVWLREDNNYTFDEKTKEVVYSKRDKISDDAKEELVLRWIAERIKEEGADYPDGINKIRNRVEKQQKKLDLLLKESAKGQGEIRPDIGEIPADPVSKDAFNEALARIKGKGGVAFQLKPGKEYQPTEEYHIDYGGREPRIPAEELKDYVTLGAYIYQNGIKDVADWKQKFTELVGKIDDNKLEKIYQAMEDRYGQQFENIKDLKQGEPTTDITGTDVSGISGGTSIKQGERPGLITIDKENIPKPKSYVGADRYSGELDEDQRLAVNLALTRFLDKGGKGFMLADGTGVGKTRSIIATANEYNKITNEPVLIISKSKTILYNNFEDDAYALGIDLDKFELGTYRGLTDGLFSGKEYGLVIFDESQELKNLTAEKTQASLDIKAKHKLFATATPTDKLTGAAYFFAEITGKTEKEIAEQLGYEISYEWDAKAGIERKYTYLLKNYSWDDVLDNLIKLRETAIKEGSLIRREYPFYGEVKFFNVDLGEEYRKNADTAYWWFQDKIDRAIKSKTKRDISGQRTLSLGRYTESLKVDKVFELMKQDLAEGKSVIIFAEGINPSTIRGVPTAEGVDKYGKRFPYHPFNGFIGELGKKLEAEGIEWAKIYGSSPERKAKEIRKFQSGEYRVAISTPQSGGSGINADDQVGDKPRVAYLVSINFAGDVNEQIFGRISRRNTKSPSLVKVIVSLDSFSDNRKYETLKKKMQVLRRIQAGEDPDIATGFDVDTDLEEIADEQLQLKPVNKYKVQIERLEKEIADIQNSIFPDVDKIRSLGNEIRKIKQRQAQEESSLGLETDIIKKSKIKLPEGFSIKESSLAELRNYREQLSSLGDKISDSDKELLNRINTRIKVIESSGEQGSLFGPEQGELFSLKTPMKDSFGNDVPKHLIKAQEYIADSKILQDINNFDIEIREPVRLNLTADEIRGYGYSDDFIKTLDKLEEGDTGYERGKEKYAVEAEGANYYDTKTGRWKIAVSSRATPSAYAEEIIHQIQRGLDKISPEMAQRIKEWENDVRTIAKENGIGIPEGYETFAQAMVFTHLGYAGENPDVAELYEVPKDIRDWFVKEVLDQSVSGRKNLSELLKGGSERRAIRLPEDKTGRELNRGIEQYNKLRQQRGERADIYPEWQKQMVKEFGGGIRKTDRKLWNEIKAAERIEANTRKGEQQNLFDNDLELFSVRNDKKDLLAINNLTADNLAFADKVGGMAMPSMAIVNKNLGLSKYGEITLVANKRLIEPERGTKVYNRDVYSPTYPIIYRHIDNARLAEKIKEIKEIIPAWALKEDGYNIARLKEDIETGKYEIGDLKNNAALKHYYLQKTKQLPEPRLRNERLKYLPESDDQYKIAEQIAEKIPEIRGGYGQIDVEFIKSKAEEYFEDDNFYKNLSEDQRRELSLERAEEKEYEARQKEREKIIKRFVNDYIDEYFKRRYKSDNIHFKELKEKLKNTTNAYNFSKDVDKLLSPKQELDYYKYNDKDVEPLIEEQKEKYLSFLKEDFDNIFGSEYILKGKKKIPHTLNNAVEVMGSKIKGAQKTLIQGLGKSAGEAAKKFTSTASIIKNKNQIVSQKEFEIAEDKLKTAFFKLSDRLRAYSTDKSEFGWDRLDNLSKAISQIAKKNPSDGYIRNYLWRNGYKDVPEYLYDDIREVVNMMKEMPTEYFEAKKERIVGLNEFVGAIVPDNVSKNTLEILEKNGIRRIKTYKFLDNEDRQRALNTFTDEMFSVRDEGTTIYDDTGTLVENERVKDVIKYRDKSALLTGESIVVHDKIRPVVFPKAVWIKKGYNPEKFNFKKLSEGDKGYVEGEERYLAYVEGSEQEGRIDIYGDTVETHGIAEEVIHKFQRKVETRNPKLAKKIKRWERAVRKAFIKQMNYNPSDKELTEFFAKSFLIDYGFPDIEGGAEGIIPENIFNETLDMLNEPIEGITGKIFEEYFPVEQRQLGKVNIPTIEEYTNKDLSLFSASGDLTPKQILTNPGGIYPTPKAIKDAINILGKDFANEFEDFKAGKKERLSRGVEEEGYLLEDFARRTVAAQKLGIEDIEGDIYGKAQELQYQLKGKPADDILRQGNEFYNKLKGRKADTYSEWRKQMLNKYGREIDPKLRGIWKEIKQAELTGIFEESKPYADFEKEQEIIDDWFKRPSPKQAREARIYGTTAASSRSINDMIQKGRANLGGAQPQGFRISDRVKEILKHFNIPIHEKHLSKKYLGVYKHITEGTRVQSIYDIVVVTHEVAHALDHRHKITDKLIAASDRGSQIRKRLTDIYEDLYPGANRSHPIKKRMTEGFATLIEHYFYDPADITKKYPVLVKEFINPSGTYYNQDISTLLAMMNGLVDDYARLEPWQRIASRIRSGKEVVENNDTGFDIFQRLKFEIFNIFEPLERISKLTGTRRTWEDPSVSAFNYLNRATIAYNWLKGDKAPLLKTNGDWEFKDETVDQYLKKISGKEKQFDSFLVARRDLELYKKIQQLRNINSDVLEALKKAVESGDTKTAHEIIKENPVVYQVHSLEKILRNDNFQLQDMQATVGAFEGQFRDAVKIFDKINQNLIDFSENTGLISSETAEAWRNEKGYASFQRYINDELLEVINKPGSDAQKNLKAKKARTGGTLDIISPVYNQILAISETINKGLNNMIWKKAYDLSKKNKEIARRFEQIETITAVEKGRIIYPQEKDPNLIRVLDNGERVFIRPAKEYVLMKEALAPMENDMFDTLVRIPSQIFIRMTTSANPIFAVANLPIDQVTLAYNTHHGTIPVASTIKNSAYLAQHFADWLQKIRTGQKMGAEGLNEYLLLGGKRQTFASEYDLAPEDLTKVIASDPTLKNKVTKWIDGTISLFELPTNYTEYASRYAEYINAKREGASMSEAMYAAAQATLPFQQYGRMGGSFGRKIVKSIPYFKPALLAVYRYMKAAKDNPVRFATLSAGFLTMALTSAAAVMLYGDEEDKRALGNLPAEELSRAMYIPNPMGKGLVRIRIPEQIGAITGLAYLYVIEHYDGNKATFDDYLRTVTSALPRQFNVTQPGEMLFGWTPQILKPGIEVATNTRTYPDLMPIVPQWMEDYYSKKDRYSDYTSYIAKKLGQWGGLSPMEIDYFVKAQFGAVGNFLMGTGDFVQGDFKRLSRINPVTRNENVFALMGRAYNHFYDRKEFYTQQYNELKGEHSYSNAEADRIKLTQKLYNDMAKQLSNARALLKEEKLTKEDKLMIWESLLLLENDRLEEAREMVDKLKSQMPEKERKEAKYNDGEPLPKSGTGSRQPRDTRQSRN